MAERGDKFYRWQGSIAEPGVAVDRGVDPGVEDVPDEELIAWRDVAAIGREQARLFALWRRGKLGNRAAKTGMGLLSSLLATAERMDGNRMAEIEALLQRIQAQVAMRPTTPPGRNRFLT